MTKLKLLLTFSFTITFLTTLHAADRSDTQIASKAIGGAIVFGGIALYPLKKISQTNEDQTDTSIPFNYVVLFGIACTGEFL